ncbi:SgcJ/EcaC family oxidoreductase [Amycolatopsis anabasis]|uniref:SgcJ/EcaC family oxidoreductase n=1 Tax=Amycolatopsis anabasis TaxID=1840409 RepID=UPI001C55584D|nr:SgcJ/EcaC family oxidoreductase [Amycolatopsis anabasis]
MQPVTSEPGRSRSGFRLVLGLFALGLTMVTACGDDSTAQDSRADDETALAKLDERQAEAWAKGDGTAWAATFTEDADFVDWMGGHLHGRATIAESFQQGFDTFMKGTRWSTPEKRTVRFVTPDVALIITSGMCVLQPDARQCRAEDLSIQTRVAVKRAGNWLCTSFHNSRIRTGGGPGS